MLEEQRRLRQLEEADVESALRVQMLDKLSTRSLKFLSFGSLLPLSYRLHEFIVPVNGK